jgi:DNA primase
MSDGTEVFKCFGCGESGNIITIIHWLEKEKKGLVVKRLAKASGIKLGRMLEGVKLEPTPMEAMEFFCSEDELYDQIAEISLEFLQVHQTEDAVNKVSRLHEALDKIAETGDGAQLQAIRERLIKTISQYSE